MATSFVLSSLLHFLPTTVLAQAKSTAPVLGAWGFEATGMDRSIKPGDDFFGYVNGNWVKQTQIPPDRSSVTMFSVLRDQVNTNAKVLMEEAVKNRQAPQGSKIQKIGDWYASFLDESQIEKLGLSPLKPKLERITAIKTRTDLARVLGENNGRLGVNPIGAAIEPNPKDPSKRFVQLSVGGYSLDSTDYYLDPKQATLRQEHQAHIARMLALAGIADSETKAAEIQALETKIVRSLTPPDANFDAEKSYNPTAIAELPQKYPGLDWSVYLTAAGVGKVSQVNVYTPSDLAAVTKLITTEPIAVWQAYLTYHLLKQSADYLPRAFREEYFAFYQKTLQGITTIPARSQAAIINTQEALPFSLSELYVNRYVDPKTKAMAEAMVDEMLSAFDARLIKLDWMTPQTRQAAREKLAKTGHKIGYPDQWPRDGEFKVIRGEALGNAQRLVQEKRTKDLAKLNQPVDRAEWYPYPTYLTDGTANPLSNEIIVGGLMLLPPFFDANADAAANYGGLGAVIAHEITHLFDSMGRQFDGDGQTRDWWTPEDDAQFKVRTAKLAAQVSTYEVLPGQFVDGQLTLRETVPDLGGIAIAYDAYQNSLKGKPAPIIDGLTGDQRFFLAWAQNWRSKFRDEYTAQLLKTDFHPPQKIRPDFVNNFEAWYKAFDVKPGDKLYLPEEERIIIW